MLTFTLEFTIFCANLVLYLMQFPVIPVFHVGYMVVRKLSSIK